MSWYRRVPGVAIIALAACQFLGGCGFQLRGASQFPLQMATTYIDAADHYSPFYKALVDAMRNGGVELTDDPTRANTVLRITKDESGRRLLSVSARNVPTEYDIYYTVEYSVAMKGKQVLPPRQLSLNRDFTFDERYVLGKAQEEQTLREAIAADLVGLVTTRLDSLR